VPHPYSYKTLTGFFTRGKFFLFIVISFSLFQRFVAWKDPKNSHYPTITHTTPPIYCQFTIPQDCTFVNRYISLCFDKNTHCFTVSYLVQNLGLICSCNCASQSVSLNTENTKFSIPNSAI